MKYIDVVKISTKSMISNKARTFLTVLGIVVGIMSIIIVFSAGEGINNLVISQIESFGTDFIEVEIKVPTGKTGAQAEQQSGSALAQGVQVTSLNLEDMDDIEKLSNISDAYSAILGLEIATYKNEKKKANLLGTNASYIDIDKSEIDQGRFFDQTEDKSLAKVVVLGKKVKEDLFGDSDAINKFINIGKSKYKVIGTMQERGAVFTLDFDNYIYMPVRTLQKRILGIDHVIYSVYKVIDMDKVEDTAEEARVILRENHDIDDPLKDDFRVVTQTEMMETLDVITGALTLLLLAIVFISLIVGGVGIMNIMYVIISERKAEIGLRKAVGASSKDIMNQFIIESILITIVGGVLGIFFGVAVSLLVAFGANQAGLDWGFSVPFSSYIVAVVFSLVFGVLFGIFPARKAAKMDPIDAIRG